MGDLGSFRAGRWAPTGEEVRLGGMKNPAELDDDALDRKAVEVCRLNISPLLFGTKLEVISINFPRRAAHPSPAASW